jgi:ribosomal protein S18 acetylase RimI-like enzyme
MWRSVQSWTEASERLRNVIQLAAELRIVAFVKLPQSSYGRRMSASGTSIEITQWSAADAQPFRDLRLEALQDTPDAFGSDYESEADRPLPYFADLLTGSIVLAAYLGEAVAGVVGLMPLPSKKYSHKGYVWGLYVTPEARGHGVAEALMRGVIARAEGLVEQLHLKVTEGNDPAIALYEKLGFRTFGVEPRALKSSGRHFDEVFMARLA